MNRSICLLAVCCLTGCASGDPYDIGKTYAVEGRLFVDGKPLVMGQGTFGHVWFHPDAAKGNKCPQVAVGDLVDEGRFKLRTRDREGAPAGWYKVAVVATEKIDPNQPAKKRKSLVNAKYGNPATSKLAVQVVEDAAARSYNLKLTK